MSKENILTTATVVLIIAAVVGVSVVLPWRYAAGRPTTYCTRWTRAVSIEPTNHDNGKYSDEQTHKY